MAKSAVSITASDHANSFLWRLTVVTVIQYADSSSRITLSDNAAQVRRNCQNGVDVARFSHRYVLGEKADVSVCKTQLPSHHLICCCACPLYAVTFRVSSGIKKGPMEVFIGEGSHCSWCSTTPNSTRPYPWTFVFRVNRFKVPRGMACVASYSCSTAWFAWLRSCLLLNNTSLHTSSWFQPFLSLPHLQTWCSGGLIFT